MTEVPWLCGCCGCCVRQCGRFPPMGFVSWKLLHMLNLKFKIDWVELGNTEIDGSWCFISCWIPGLSNGLCQQDVAVEPAIRLDSPKRQKEDSAQATELNAMVLPGNGKQLKCAMLSRNYVSVYCRPPSTYVSAFGFVGFVCFLKARLTLLRVERARGENLKEYCIERTYLRFLNIWAFALWERLGGKLSWNLWIGFYFEVLKGENTNRYCFGFSIVRT